MQKRIAIQGQQASFHEAALNIYYGDLASAIYCHTFRDVIRFASEDDECHGAVFAIENSIAGSILPNYKILSDSKLKVSGEIYMIINQQLLVRPGLCLNDITEIHSHPMALQQCMNYLQHL